MKKILFILLFTLITLPVFAKNTILILGDSLSAAYNMETNQGWVELLKTRLEDENYNYEVINLSISGSTTSNGLTQLPDALNRYHPNITIIELGGNDGLRGIPLMVIKQHLQKLIQLALDADSKILLLGIRLPPNYGPDYTQQFQQIYVDLAKDNAISVVPLFLKNVDTDSTLIREDRIHPNDKAQPILLDNVWEVLKGILSH